MNPNNPEDFKKSNKRSFLITIMGLAIIVISYLLFVQNQVQLNVTITEVTHARDSIKKHDSIVSDDLIKVRKVLKEVQDSIQKGAPIPTLITKDDAILIVLKYYLYRKQRNLDSVLLFLDPKIDRFYTAENVNHQFVASDLSRYWENHIESKYDMDYLDMQLTLLDKTHYEAVISGIHYTKEVNKNNDTIQSEQGIIATFKINTQKKIYFVREKVTD